MKQAEGLFLASIFLQIPNQEYLKSSVSVKTMLSRYAFRAMASRRCLPAPVIAQSSHYSSISAIDVAERTNRILKAKDQSGLTYDDLATKLGVTNTYAAQLLLGQAKLTKESAVKLQEALPSASSEDIEEMQSAFPMRTFDENILKEPNVYRTYEAITHYGESIKSIINEQCGDGKCVIFSSLYHSLFMDNSLFMRNYIHLNSFALSCRDYECYRFLL